MLQSRSESEHWAVSKRKTLKTKVWSLSRVGNILCPQSCHLHRLLYDDDDAALDFYAITEMMDKHYKQSPDSSALSNIYKDGWLQVLYRHEWLCLWVCSPVMEPIVRDGISGTFMIMVIMVLHTLITPAHAPRRHQIRWNQIKTFKYFPLYQMSVPSSPGRVSWHYVPQ